MLLLCAQDISYNTDFERLYIIFKDAFKSINNKRNKTIFTLCIQFFVDIYSFCRFSMSQYLSNGTNNYS